MAKTDEPAVALDPLEQRKKSGAISEGEYQVCRHRLMEETAAEVPPWRKEQNRWSGRGC